MSKKRRAFEGRKKIIKSLKPVFYITCEGITEYNYLNEFRMSRKLSSLQIKVISGKKAGGTDPLSLVRHIIDEVEDKDLYEELWYIHDCDEHPNIKKAFEIAQQKGIKRAFSNPSFELWVLIHYQNQTAYIHREKTLSEVKKHITKYEKGMEGLYFILLNKQGRAIKRAQQLEAMHIRNTNDKTENPSTSMHELIESLNSKFQ